MGRGAVKRPPNFYIKELQEKATFFILDELEKEHFQSAYAAKSSYKRNRKNANYYQAVRDILRGMSVEEAAKIQDVDVPALRNGIRIVLLRIDNYKKRVNHDQLA